MRAYVMPNVRKIINSRSTTSPTGARKNPISSQRRRRNVILAQSLDLTALTLDQLLRAVQKRSQKGGVGESPSEVTRDKKARVLSVTLLSDGETDREYVRALLRTSMDTWPDLRRIFTDLSAKEYFNIPALVLARVDLTTTDPPLTPL